MEYLCCWTLSKYWSFGLKGSPDRRTVVVVGEKGSGKTSLIFRFTRGRMPCSQEMRSSLDTDFVDVLRNGVTTRLCIYDTSGDDAYAKLRALPYSKADCIMICLPLDSRASLRRLELDFVPEVRCLCQGKPYILVGTKRDTRYSGQGYSESTAITEKQGRRMAKVIGAVAYLECSALDDASGGRGVNRVFGRAVKECVRRK
ncbi:hypothetical protein BsWGS_21652 [Bradybaena similaris]